MGRIYSAEFQDVSVAVAQDLFSILPASNVPISIHQVSLSQNSEVADAAEEGLTISIIAGNTTTGSGGSAGAGEPLNFRDAADSATVRTNDTTEMSAGTAVVKHSEAWNIRMPFIYLPAPEDRIIVANALFFGVQLITVPADAIIMSGTVIYEELA